MAPPFADGTPVCFSIRGVPGRDCGTLKVQRNNSPPTWGVLANDPQIYLDSSEICDVSKAPGAETHAQRRMFGGGPTVGSFWGGLAKLANPFSSPLSPIAQVRRTVNAFRGGGGGPAPPPSYYQQPPPFDPSQQQYAPPPFDPLQQQQQQQYAPPPAYASPMYAPTPMYGPSPAADWSQYSTPGSSWDAMYGPSQFY